MGSILCGEAELIGEARYRRRQLGAHAPGRGDRRGGGCAWPMRIDYEDHALAERLARGLSDRFPKAIDPDDVETNMVMVDDAGLPVGGLQR